VPILPDGTKRFGLDGLNGQGYGPTSNSNSNINSSYFNRDFKNAAGDYSRNGNGLVGGGGDFEVNTWWLDVQSPTDEEMKMLSKVGYSNLRGNVVHR
jgi:magnesium transporter